MVQFKLLYVYYIYDFNRWTISMRRCCQLMRFSKLFLFHNHIEQNFKIHFSLNFSLVFTINRLSEVLVEEIFFLTFLHLMRIFMKITDCIHTVTPPPPAPHKFGHHLAPLPPLSPPPQPPPTLTETHTKSCNYPKISTVWLNCLVMYPIM